MTSLRTSSVSVALCAAMLISGCASIDRSTLSHFEMTDDGWRMTAKTAANYAPDSDRAEAIRLEWIRQYTEANGCKGFDVTSRRWTKEPTDNFVRTGFSENVGLLTYTGTCRKLGSDPD